MQLEAIASCPIARYLGEETNTCLTTTSSQIVMMMPSLFLNSVEDRREGVLPEVVVGVI